MAVGFQMFRPDGTPLFGEGYPFMQISGGGTYSGTLVTLGINTWYHYPNTLFGSQYTFPAFARLDVGDTFVASNYGGVRGFASTRPSLEFRFMRPASDLPNPTGYDIVVWNATGQKQWVASQSAITLNGRYRVEWGSGTLPPITVPTGLDWVAPLSLMPFIRINNNMGSSVMTGLNRFSTNQYRWGGLAGGAAPAIQIGPFPTDFLLAG